MNQKATRIFLGTCALCLLLTSCRQRSSALEGGDDSGEKTAMESTAQPPGQPGESEDLLQAALEGRADEVHLILQTGMDINSTDEEGHTALMFAAFNGHASIVLELVGRGAIVDQPDQQGRTALLYAATGPFPETVKILLDHGADPNQVDTGEHFSPLMHAAAEGHLEVVKLLIENGADPSLKDIDGDLAETFARQAGHLEVAAYLEALP